MKRPLKRRRSGTGFLERLAQVLSVLTATAFLVSAIINTLIFWSWGVAFLAIATPTDVLMSGLQIMIYCAVLWLVAAMLIVGIYPDQAASKFGIAARRYLLLGSALAAGAAVVSLMYVSRNSGGLTPVDVRNIGIAGFASVASIFGLMAFDAGVPQGLALEVALARLANGVPDPPGVRPVPAMLALLAATACVAVGGQVAEGSFVPSPTWADGPGGGCAPLHVLWIGQSSIVASCPETGEVRVVARGGEGMVLRVADRRPPPLRPGTAATALPTAPPQP